MIRNQSHFLEILVGAIAQRAAESGNRLTKTRLVKFLYLLDLFHAQSEQRTLTDWPWAFVHYGPYCRESTDVIDRAEAGGYIFSRSYESRFADDDYKLYSPGDQLPEHEIEAVRKQLPRFVWANLTSAIYQWSGDTYGLLDYVYFRTGPMANAQPGELLSFKDETRPDLSRFAPIKLRPLSNTKKKKAREAIARIKASARSVSYDPRLMDEAYFSFVTAAKEDETPTGLSGIAAHHFDTSDD